MRGNGACIGLMDPRCRSTLRMIKFRLKRHNSGLNGFRYYKSLMVILVLTLIVIMNLARNVIMCKIGGLKRLRRKLRNNIIWSCRIGVRLILRFDTLDINRMNRLKICQVNGFLGVNSVEGTIRRLLTGRIILLVINLRRTQVSQLTNRCLIG